MALSKASCTGRGLIPAIGGHVHRMFDEGEDDLFSLSLDDVMDDRPWTADELMGGEARPSSPNPTLAPKPASAPTPAQSPVRRPRLRPHPLRRPRPPRPASDPSETAAFLAAATQGKSADSTVMYSAQQLPVPAARKPPVTRLDPLPIRLSTIPGLQPIWNKSTGMPALDVPVNPLFAANTSAADYEGGAALSDYSDGYAGNGRIETEDYGTASSDYLNDPYAATPAPEYDPEAASAPAYTKSTGEERFADYYTEEKALRFSEFPQAVKVAFIAIIIALLGVIRLRDSSCSAAPPKRSRRPSKKEDDNRIWTSTPSRATPTTKTI